MGRRRFRLSDMMPNTWFYKLRDMRHRSGAGGPSVKHQSSSCLGARASTQVSGTPRPAPLPHRTSYYYASRDRVLRPSPAPLPTTLAAADTADHHQLVPQTKSPSKSYKRLYRVGPVGNGKETERAELAPVAPAPGAYHRRRDTRIGRGGTGDVGGNQLRRSAAARAPSSKNIFTGRVIASDTEIIFDLSAEDDVPERALRPIATKPKPARRGKESHGAAATPRTSSASEKGGSRDNPRRSSVSSGRRLKTRANSPRMASRCRKGKPTTPAPPPLAESFAVVKASYNPRKDFRESMEEMIADKGIRTADDLEDLLAFYLALNAAKHHRVIIEVFEEIWVNLATIDP